MAHEYAALLSDYDDKGVLGAPEFVDDEDTISKGVSQLTEWIQRSACCVVITGAGISTSAGIADFRGPKGIWTLEKSGEVVEPSRKSIESFEDAKPTITHDSLKYLEAEGRIAYLVTQNVDGLHSRFGFPLDKLSEVHGNVFQMRCSVCNRAEFSKTPLKSVGRKPIGIKCTDVPKARNRCKGEFCDFLLDWDDQLPEPEYTRSLKHLNKADLVLCLGTSLQIDPVGQWPLLCKKRGGRIVTINLQHTKIENEVDLAIHCPVDRVMSMLLSNLNVSLVRTEESTIIRRSLRPIPRKRKLSGILNAVL